MASSAGAFTRLVTRTGCPDTNAARGDRKKRRTGPRRVSAPRVTYTSCAVEPFLPISLAMLRTKPSSPACAAAASGVSMVSGGRPTTRTRPLLVSWRTHGPKKSYSARRSAGWRNSDASNSSAAGRRSSGAGPSSTRGGRPKASPASRHGLASMAPYRTGLAPAGPSVRANSSMTGPWALPPTTMSRSTRGRSSYGPLPRRNVSGMGIGRPRVFTSFLACGLELSSSKKSLIVNLVLACG